MATKTNTNWFNKFITFGHPYKLSIQKQAYEEIAEICGTSPDRVYNIAHGKRGSSFEDAAIVAELLSRGILRRRPSQPLSQEETPRKDEETNKG